MVPAKRTLAIVVLTTTLVSCSNQAVPATTPTFPLVIDLTTVYAETHSHITFDTQSANYQTMLDHLLNGITPYFISTHLSSDGLWAAPIGQDGIAIIVNRNLN